MRIASTAIGALVVMGSIVGCQPATTYGRGMDMSFHPSGKADGQSRIVDSAVELKQESDQETIKEAGGVYLGELEVTAEKSTAYASGATAGGATLRGRVSLDVAAHGGTHFYLTTLDTELPVGRGRSAERTHARYVIYRVEPELWAKLDKAYQPTPRAVAVTSAP